MVLLDPRLGGRCIEEETSFSGPSVLIVEILSSKPWMDLVTKRDAYALAGVAESWVLNPAEQQAAFLRLHERHYQESALLCEGLYETPRLPGFRLDVGALFRQDFAALIAGLGASN